MKNKYFLPIIIITFVVVLGLGIVYYNKDSGMSMDDGNMMPDGQASSTQTGATSTATNNGQTTNVPVQGSTNLRRYSDLKNKFIIDYPATAQLDTSIVMFHDLPDKWRLSANNYAGQGLLTVKVFRVDSNGSPANKPYPLFYTAEVRVGVSDNTTECYNADPAFADQKAVDVNINGVVFKKFTFSNAAMMKYVQGVSYRTIKDNRCYTIEQVRNGSSYRDDTMKGGLTQAQLDAYFATAGTVAQSFRFIK